MQRNVRNNQGPRRANNQEGNNQVAPRQPGQPFVRPKYPGKQQFKNGQLQELVVNQKIGPEGKKYLKTKYSHITTYFNDRIDHPHGFGALLRATFEKKMVNLVAGKLNGLNIGANAARINRFRTEPVWKTAAEIQGTCFQRELDHTGEDWTNGAWVRPYLADSCRSMCPNISEYDQIRRANWTESIINDDGLRIAGRNAPINVCWTCKGGRHADFCDECAMKYEYTMSSDAIYYPGVFEEHEKRLVEDGAVAYFAFMDYHTPIISGQTDGEYWDSEGKWSYDKNTGTVYVKVSGNPITYEHGVLRTAGQDSWLVKSNYPNVYLFIETLEKWMYRDVPGRICKMTKVQVPLVSGEPGPVPYKLAEFYVDNPLALFVCGKHTIPTNQTATFVHTIESIPTHKVGKTDMEKLVDMVKEQMLTRSEEIIVDETNSEVILRRWRKTYLGGKRELPQLRASIADVGVALNRTIGVVKASGVVMTYKKMGAEIDKLMMEPTSGCFEPDPVRRFIRHREMVPAFIIADVLSAENAIEVGQNHLWSDTKERLHNTMDGIKVTTQRWKVKVTEIILFLVCAMGITMFYVLMNYFYKTIMATILVRANPYDKIEEDNYWNEIFDVVMPLTLGLLTTARLYSKRRFKNKLSVISKPFILQSQCVRDLNRLDNKLQSGRFDNKLKIRDDTKWSSNFMALQCDAVEKPGAIQVMPLFNYPDQRLPSVLHSCTKVMGSATLRACSNWAEPDPIEFAKFAKWFRQVIIPEFLDGLDGQIHEITIDKWLNKYPLNYQKQMRAAMEKPGWFIPRHYTYESFPKVELQVTTVPFVDQMSDLNTVKERQISGPPAEKKILVNPIINYFESIAGKSLKGYCGSATYVEIADKITDLWNRVPNPVMFTMDGSGFDMTQLTGSNELVNELILEGLKHHNVILEDPLSYETTKFILEDSMVLDVNVDRGSVNYKAEGRASGDGWTTFGNTVLSTAYGRYTAYHANIDDSSWGGLYKGDDVIGVVSGFELPFLDDSRKKLFLEKNEPKKHGLGQVVKFIKFGRPEVHDFLSCDLMFDKFDRIRLVNKPMNIVQKIGLTTRYNQHLYNEWVEKGCQMNKPEFDALVMDLLSLLLDKVGSLNSLMGDLPIWRSVVKTAFRLARNWGVKTPAGRDRGYSDTSKNRRDDCDDSLAYLNYLNMHWGVTMDDVVYFERVMDSVINPFEILEIPFLMKFLE